MPRVLLVKQNMMAKIWGPYVEDFNDFSEVLVWKPFPLCAQTIFRENSHPIGLSQLYGPSILRNLCVRRMGHLQDEDSDDDMTFDDANIGPAVCVLGDMLLDGCT